MGNIKFNFDRAQLDRIAKFVGEPHEVKIGILSNEWKQNPGKDWERKIGPVELAMIHEFGSRKRRIPERSFLRLTMATRGRDFKANIEANRDTIMERIASGQGSQILQKIGIQWRAYVLEAFETGGPGWAPLSPKTIAMRRAVWTGEYLKDKKGNELLSKRGKRMREYKQSTKILWVTGAMARSITYQVTK